MAHAKSKDPAPQSRTVSGAGPSDAALVVAARAGERWAQEAIFRRHGPAVNRLAHRLMAGDADVDDVVQDVFVAAFEQLTRLSEPAALGGWLRSMVVFVVHKRVRRARLMRRLGLRRPEEIDFDALISDSAPPDVRAEISRVYEVARELPAAARIALLLHRVEGYAMQEVADELGVSLATAKRRLAVAEAELARRLGDR